MLDAIIELLQQEQKRFRQLYQKRYVGLASMPDLFSVGHTKQPLEKAIELRRQATEKEPLIGHSRIFYHQKNETIHVFSEDDLAPYMSSQYISIELNNQLPLLFYLDPTSNETKVVGANSVAEYSGQLNCTQRTYLFLETLLSFFLKIIPVLKNINNHYKKEKSIILDKLLTCQIHDVLVLLCFAKDAFLPNKSRSLAELLYEFLGPKGHAHQKNAVAPVVTQLTYEAGSFASFITAEFLTVTDLKILEREQLENWQSVIGIEKCNNYQQKLTFYNYGQRLEKNLIIPAIPGLCCEPDQIAAIHERHSAPVKQLVCVLAEERIFQLLRPLEKGVIKDLLAPYFDWRQKIAQHATIFDQLAGEIYSAELGMKNIKLRGFVTLLGKLPLFKYLMKDIVSSYCQHAMGDEVYKKIAPLQSALTGLMLNVPRLLSDKVIWLACRLISENDSAEIFDVPFFRKTSYNNITFWLKCRLGAQQAKAHILYFLENLNEYFDPFVDEIRLDESDGAPEGVDLKRTLQFYLKQKKTLNTVEIKHRALLEQKVYEHRKYHLDFFWQEIQCFFIQDMRQACKHFICTLIILPY